MPDRAEEGHELQQPGRMKQWFTLRALCLAVLAFAGGCSTFVREEPAPPPPPEPEVHAPIATQTFTFDPETTGVVGELQVTVAREEDTLADIARRFNLGFDELLHANPGVDPWLPGGGTPIVLPTQFVLPDAKPEGVVINVAALRLFYFPKAAPGEPRVVRTYPTGVGKVGWATPLGRTKIVAKRKNPVWTPPASVRREHAAAGDPLPARVPAGPDNPLGTRAMNLGWPSYLIHGTNKPAGVGMRASHGCIRLYPEDVEALYDELPTGTRVTVVNQPLLYRWQDDRLYVQSYPPFEDHEHDADRAKRALLEELEDERTLQRLADAGGAVDPVLIEQVIDEGRGVAVPVTVAGQTYDAFLASARRVENAVPVGSNRHGHGEEDADAGDPLAGTTGH
jgi:L,D-transpeptidase ErfK/SrfK